MIGNRMIEPLFPITKLTAWRKEHTRLLNFIILKHKIIFNGQFFAAQNRLTDTIWKFKYWERPFDYPKQQHPQIAVKRGRKIEERSGSLSRGGP